MIDNDYAAPRREPSPLWTHPLTLDRRRRERESYERMVLRFKWFGAGVITVLVMLLGVTFVDCLTRLAGRC